jgi:hypothetical protein
VFIYSLPADGHQRLHVFPLAIMNAAVLNIHLQASVQANVFISLGCITRRIFGSSGISMFPTTYKSSYFFTSLPTFIIFIES